MDEWPICVSLAVRLVDESNSNLFQSSSLECVKRYVMAELEGRGEGGGKKSENSSLG